jgi:hypothetical protein
VVIPSAMKYGGKSWFSTVKKNCGENFFKIFLTNFAIKIEKDFTA